MDTFGLVDCGEEAKLLKMQIYQNRDTPDPHDAAVTESNLLL